MDDSPQGYRLISVDGRAVARVLPMGDQFPPEVPTNWLVYFVVDDAQAASGRRTATGGGVVAPPFDTPPGTWSRE